MALTKINRFREMVERMRSENKLEHLNSKEDIESMVKSNEDLEKMRRDYRNKEYNSFIDSFKVLLH